MKPKQTIMMIWFWKNSFMCCTQTIELRKKNFEIKHYTLLILISRKEQYCPQVWAVSVINYISCRVVVTCWMSMLWTSFKLSSSLQWSKRDDWLSRYRSNLLTHHRSLIHLFHFVAGGWTIKSPRTWKKVMQTNGSKKSISPIQGDTLCLL